MSIFKCKMCGGTLEIQPNATVAECEYCGTTQTLPKLDDGRKANLFDRANHFRRNNEFDKAAGIYEQILNEDGSDAEIYWSLVLCRYGVEYVEDPATHKRVPTVNRAQFTSIFDDDNYKSALNYADGYQRSIYEDEAKAINEIQKGILAISQKEEPFDVFICYKETDNSGRRTPDSVLATDLYHQLTQEGFKVFFSRITLEDKLGIAYEPYIFAALNSAKVMVVLGTKPEYFNAVWVKNEWGRYLALIKAGAKKLLIPAYKDMDPYDLPEEFSHLQAQDMSKLGFMQDLIHGIKKLIGTKSPVSVSDNTEQLLKRAFLALEDGDWKQADSFCELVLNQNAEHPRAYLGKLMAELHVHREADLAQQQEPFDNNPLYQKVCRFDNGFLTVRLQGYIDAIRSAKEQDEQEKKDQKERRWLLLTSKKNLCRLAIAAVVGLAVGIVIVFGVKNHQKKTATYENAMALLNAGSYTEAIEAFNVLDNYKDSEIRKAEAEQFLEEVLRREEAYVTAVALLEGKLYDEAISAFEALGDYLDSAKQVQIAEQMKKAAVEEAKKSASYEEAVQLLKQGDYVSAINEFAALGDYLDSTEKLAEAEMAKQKTEEEAARAEAYDAAIKLMDEEKYSDAKAAFEALGEYSDAKNKAEECQKKMEEIAAANAVVQVPATQEALQGNWYGVGTWVRGKQEDYWHFNGNSFIWDIRLYVEDGSLLVHHHFEGTFSLDGQALWLNDTTSYSDRDGEREYNDLKNHPVRLIMMSDGTVSIAGIAQWKQ